MSAPVATASPSPLARSRGVFSSPKYGPVVVAVLLFFVLLVAAGLRYPGFLSAQVLLNLLIDNAYLIVLAVGMTFVILTGGIDLSVGAVVALSAMIVAELLHLGLPAAVVMIAAILGGSLLGFAVGLMVQVFKIEPFIATLAAMFFARGVCYIISQNAIPITDPIFVSLAVTRITLAPGVSITPSVIIALAVVVIAILLLQFTRFGRTVYAIGGGEHGAVLMGLPVARTKVLVYVVAGVCSGIAGVLFSFYTLSGYPLTAVGTELDAIAAVVIGGTLLAGGYGFVWGSVVGVLVLGIIQTILSFEGTLSSWWTRIFIGALLLGFIVLQKALTSRRR